MTYRELEEAIRKIIPGASFEEDNYGQIVIYTDLTRDENNNLKEFTLEEE